MHYRDIESGSGGLGGAAAGVTSGYRRPPLVVALSNGAWHEEFLSTPHKRVSNSDRFPAAKSQQTLPPPPQQQAAFLHPHPSPKARDPSSFSNLKPDSTMTSTAAAASASASKLSRSPSSLSRSPTIKSNIDSLSSFSDAASRSYETGLGGAGTGTSGGGGSRSFDKNVGLAREASLNRAILMGDISFSSGGSGGSAGSSPTMMMMQHPQQHAHHHHHHSHHHHAGGQGQAPQAERRLDAQALVPALVLVTVPFVWWYVKGTGSLRHHRLPASDDVALWYWFDFLALLVFFTALVVSARLAFPQLYVLYKAPPPPAFSLAARAVLGQSWGSLSSGLLKPLAALLSPDDKLHQKKRLLRKEPAALLPVAAAQGSAGTAKVTWTIGSSGGGAPKSKSEQQLQQEREQQQQQREKEKFLREGVQSYSNGDIYEGEFHEGRCAGSGVYYFYMSGRYEGEWADGKYDGYGVETWARGSRYRGQYARGLRDGFGVYRFYTGDVYSGEWSNGQSHGCGTQTCEDGSRYRGEFKWGVKHGFGFYHFRNGDTYAGEYFADKMHGYGVYQFANGHRYEGSWHEGRKQGLGIYTFRNGETHAGHWHHGALETRSSQNPTPGSPAAVSHSKVLNAVQESRRAAAKAMDVSRVEDRVNKAVASANRSANAARVAAVKAVQKRNSSPLYADRV